MSDSAVKAKTGKTWPQWFTSLDKAGAKKMNHKEIVAYLVKHQDVGPWWRQMVTVTYEQARGLRAKHERPDGYSISRSKTLNVPISAAYKAWNEPKLRARWLGRNGFSIRKATPNRSIRMTWIDGKTTVETMFYPKGAGKAQVTVQHNRLADARAGEKMKKFWGKRLDQLQTLLET
jgi:uncharacterized protein YndB with AHSA1/START domain